MQSEEDLRAQTHVEPHATAALQIDDLSWWTTDRDVMQVAQLATGTACVVDIAFLEHKANGKSRGSAWVLFTSVEAAQKTKAQLERIEIDKRIPCVKYMDPKTNTHRMVSRDMQRAASPELRRPRRR